MIVDSHSIKTRSFNYTQTAAFRNAENVIYMYNTTQRQIPKKYIQEFNHLCS